MTVLLNCPYVERYAERVAEKIKDALREAVEDLEKGAQRAFGTAYLTGSISAYRRALEIIYVCPREEGGCHCGCCARSGGEAS